MKTINHDPKEKRPKATFISVLVVAISIGIGLSISRGTFDGMPYGHAVLLTAIALCGGAIYFGAIYFLLAGWDRLWARLKRRFTASR